MDIQSLGTLNLYLFRMLIQKLKIFKIRNGFKVRNCIWSRRRCISTMIYKNENNNNTLMASSFAIRMSSLLLIATDNAFESWS